MTVVEPSQSFDDVRVTRCDVAVLAGIHLDVVEPLSVDQSPAFGQDGRAIPARRVLFAIDRDHERARQQQRPYDRLVAPERG